MFITQTRTAPNVLAGENCEETARHANIEYGLEGQARTTPNIHSSVRRLENEKGYGLTFNTKFTADA